MTKNELHIGQITLPYEVTWSENRSTIGIELTSDKELIVKAPITANDGDIERVLENKKPWLLKKLSGLEERSSSPREKEFYSGEKLLYNGRRYRLKLDLKETDGVEVHLKDNLFIITAPESLGEDQRRKEIKNSLLNWYKKRAKNNFKKRTKRYARKLDIEKVEVNILDSSRKWGELKDEVIALHWKLVLAPVKIQDYVIVHELAHFKHKNHTSGFWNTVGAVLPDYEERKKWLRLNSAKLEI
ncbi:MAG: SprT family zinc-dependent metalloprotease [Candidatus Paceibacterota bacterium]